MGLAIQSNVSTLPLGVYAEFDYKFAHFAVDASFGGSLAQAFTTKQTVSLNIGNTTTTQSEKLLESNEKPSWFIGGSLGLNLMNYVTLDFGLGALKSIVVSKYEITTKNTSTTGVTAGTTTATSGISIENKTTEFRESSGDKYLYLKPGIRGYIPLDSNGLRLSLGVSYLICPKNKSMNTWIGSIGIAFILE